MFFRLKKQFTGLSIS